MSPWSSWRGINSSASPRVALALPNPSSAERLPTPDSQCTLFSETMMGTAGGDVLAVVQTDSSVCEFKVFRERNRVFDHAQT